MIPRTINICLLRTSEQPSVPKAELYYQAEAGGRKADGVFYTRHEFVKHLLKNSLLPALESHLDEVENVAKRDAYKAAQNLFDFSVVDPAMGSAHFLTVALDMMADRIELFLAKVGLPAIKQQLDELMEDGDQSLDAGDLLRRLILKRCIYGVDLSPLAVEIANVTLWLTSFVPGLTLSYLGSNLKCGNALIGVVNPEVVRAGDGLFTGGQYVIDTMNHATQLQLRQSTVSDRNPDEVKRSRNMYFELRKMTDGLRLAFHMWTTEPLGLAENRFKLVEYGQDIIENKERLNAETIDVLNKTEQLAQQHNLFHWPLEFPHIFHRDNPGFDVVIGNPPWNEMTIEELGFYSLRDPGLHGLVDLQERVERIADLDRQNPAYRIQFEEEKRRLSVIRAFFSRSEDYKLQGSGDTDLYQLFCERYTHLLRQGGYLGVVLPRAAFLVDGANGFRRWLFTYNRLRRLDFILNNKKWAFSNVHPQYTVALMAGRHELPENRDTFKVTGPSTNLTEFHSARRRGIDIMVSSLGSLYIVPLVQDQAQVDVLVKIRHGIRFDALQFPKIQKKSREHTAVSCLVPYAEIHETQQRALFSYPDGDGRIPVWKGRTFDQYDPHGRNPAGYGLWNEILQFVQSRRTRSRVFKNIYTSAILADPNAHPIMDCRISFRDITNRTNSRTIISCLVPPQTPLTNKAPYLIFSGWPSIGKSYVLGVLNSIPFDWIARRYAETSINYYILKQLCFPPWESTPWKRIGALAARLSCVDNRFDKFAADVGVECGSLEDSKRNDMRAEIDALVGNSYGLTENEMRFVFTDFTENAVTLPYRELVMSKFNDCQTL